MNYLFLRGLARHQYHWYKFEENFKTESNQVLLIDIPGNGEFYEIDSLSTISENTTFLKELFESKKEKKDSNEKWCVVAISLGGMIALDWMEKYPNDFCKAFIINTSAKNIISPMKRLSLKFFLKLPILFFATHRLQEYAILNITLNNRVIDENILKMATNFIFRPTTRKNVFIQLLCASRFVLPKVISKEKVVIICSENDRLVSCLASKEIARQFSLPIFNHPTAGHDIPLDNPDWLIPIIKSI